MKISLLHKNGSRHKFAVHVYTKTDFRGPLIVTDCVAPVSKYHPMETYKGSGSITQIINLDTKWKFGQLRVSATVLPGEVPAVGVLIE
jgi:hypothetical protein